MGEFVIHYDERTVERAVYGLIITILLVLLILIFFRNCECAGTGVNASSATGLAMNANGTNESLNVTIEDDEANVTDDADDEPAPTCSDDIKNGDETDVDCGGSRCAACDEGMDCVLNADCDKGSCDNGVCDASEDLSGEFKLLIESIEVSGGDETAAVVEKLEVSMENGLEDNINVEIEMFVLSSNEKAYLSQPTPGEINPYAIIPVGAMTAGWVNNNQPYDLRDLELYEGPKYLTDTTGNYEKGDDFVIQLIATNTKTGKELADAKYTYRG